MKETLNFVAFYPHSPERVWRALTSSEELSSWFLPADFKTELGYRFTFEQFRGEVLEVEAAKLLRYSWEDGESGTPSIVTWRLDPTDGGTLLTLEHTSPFDQEPVVLIEAAMNWAAAFSRVSVPIVYCEDEPSEPVLARAGFRQEEPCPVQ